MDLTGRLSKSSPTSSGLIGRLGSSNPQNPTPNNSINVLQTMNGKPSMVLKPVSSAGSTISQAPEQKWPGGFVGAAAKAAFDTAKSTVDNAATKLQEMVAASNQGYNLNDYQKLSLEGKPGENFDQTATRLGINKNTPLKRVVATGSAGLGVAGIGFLPVTAQIEAAKQLPGPLALPAKIASGIFEDLGKLGSFTFSKGVDVLPVSDETKTTIRPLAEELGAFVAQLVGIKAAHTVASEGLNLKGLKLKEETRAKVSNAAQFATGISITPFSTAYGLVNSRIAFKVAEKQAQGVEVTPEVGKTIMEEVKQEVSSQPLPDTKPSQPEFLFEKPVEIPKAPDILKSDTVSGVAKSIEAKAVENKLTTGVNDLATYDSRTFAVESAKAAELAKNIEDLRATIRGEKPTDIRAGALIAEAEKYAKEHPVEAPDIIQELANSKLPTTISEGASQMSFARMREVDSAASRLNEVKKTYEAKVKNLPQKETKLKNDLKSEVEKFNLSKEELSFDNFLKNIIC